jgi:hypothetical protein
MILANAVAGFVLFDNQRNALDVFAGRFDPTLIVNGNH